MYCKLDVLHIKGYLGPDFVTFKKGLAVFFSIYFVNSITCIESIKMSIGTDKWNVAMRILETEMLHSHSNKAPAIFVSFLLTEITTVMILGSFPYHGRTL